MPLLLKLAKVPFCRRLPWALIATSLHSKYFHSCSGVLTYSWDGRSVGVGPVRANNGLGRGVAGHGVKEADSTSPTDFISCPLPHSHHLPTPSRHSPTSARTSYPISCNSDPLWTAVHAAATQTLLTCEPDMLSTSWKPSEPLSQ